MRAARLIVAAACCAWAAAVAAAQGQATGTLTIDGVPTTLSHALRTTTDNAFDETARDPLILLSNRPLTAEDAAAPDALRAKAARGERVLVAVRFDGRPGRARLFNVALSYQGHAEPVLLPDVWFDYAVTGTGGTLKLPTREFQGRTYQMAAEFAIPVFDKAATTASPAAGRGGPALPPPSRTDEDRRKATALLIDALREGDERRALAIVELGVDPNGRDQTLEIPVLAWAVIMCQPPVVAALVERGADVAIQRLPGMTLQDEAAAACPDALRFLKK